MGGWWTGLERGLGLWRAEREGQSGAKKRGVQVARRRRQARRPLAVCRHKSSGRDARAERAAATGKTGVTLTKDAAGVAWTEAVNGLSRRALYRMPGAWWVRGQVGK